MEDGRDGAWRRLFFAAAGLLAAGVLGWAAVRMLARIPTTLTVLAVGGAIAFVLAPLADRLERLLRRRWLAVLVVLAGLLGTAVMGVVLVLGPLTADLLALVQRAPAYVRGLEEAAGRAMAWLEARGMRGPAEESVRRALASLQARAPGALTAVIGVLGAIGNALTVSALGLVTATYLLLDGRRIRSRALGLIPPRWRDEVELAAAIAARILGGYLRGQLLLAVVIGVTAGVGTALLGLPYPVFLGVVAGVFELIPTVGAFLGALPALAVAAFEPFPRVLYTAAFFAALQQLEGAVLVPRITGRAVGLHPLAALLALLAGYEAAGITGALVAVPVAAIGWSIFAALRRRALADPPGLPPAPAEP